MKRFILFTIASVFIFLLASAAWYASRLHHDKEKHISNTVNKSALTKTTLEKITQRTAEALQYTKANKYNTQLCFFIDMSIESGHNRFFVYDLQKDSILGTGLVTHGSCNETWLKGRKYGNTPGCGCSSLGKYKVGNPYKGRFGLAYKLYGLDTSNSNAYNRFVVLHSMECVPEKEVSPYPICQSNGCPTVSPGFLQQLATIIDASKRPVLLWMYE